MNVEHAKLITSNPNIPSKPRVSLSDAIDAVYNAIERDPTFLDRFLSKVDPDKVKAFVNKPRLADYPADPETVEITVWDNDYGKRVSKIDARYCVQVKANKAGNTKLSAPNFDGNADLLTPAKIRKRAKRWGMSPADQAIFDKVVSDAEKHDFLVGRLVRVVRFHGSHTFHNHFVLMSPLQEGVPPTIILSVPNGLSHFVADKVTNSKGGDFVVNTKKSGQRSKAIWQCRYSTSPAKSEWTK